MASSEKKWDKFYELRKEQFRNMELVPKKVETILESGNK